MDPLNVKCESLLYKISTFVYTVFSFVNIILQIVNQNTSDYKHFLFVIFYFIAILLAYVTSMEYVFKCIKQNDNERVTDKFSIIFILECASFSLSICYIYPHQTTYHKIVDIYTLSSSTIYQAIIVFIVYCRIINKINKNKPTLDIENDGETRVTYTTLKPVFV